ncbi:GMC oxidoreductase [Sistotremastrum niveocremeum HHB9708]|uniref:GMC oxidoreductase n=1 Tax=Sistotremastrum niveocremeum HHB9708 TaxID=1314777 RepID=A0A164WQ68_9AGAM|nr:GMC oxidoreductase [Sistotremastrum niveocremeum HHB9708]
MGSSNSILGDTSAADAYYDFIIVGAGAAGCVLANRLSEDPAVSVLLVEAGKSHLDELKSKIPMTFPQIFKTPQDWAYETIPQRNVKDRSFFWPRGKILGGSTSLNAMMYHHCAPSDYDEWTGDAPGWSYEAMRPYFRKAENYAGHELHTDVDLSHRGAGGLWQTRHAPRIDICNDCLQSCRNVGIPYNSDFNTPNGTLGCNHITSFLDPKGHRSSAATAYLSPILNTRPNLHIVTMTTTTRLIFSPLSAVPTVMGIEVARTPVPGKEPSSERWIINARREVILSSGSINTPQLLMLSGIGPKVDLDKVGIPLVKHLAAVGQNLYDHVVSGGISFRAAKPGTTLDYLANPANTLLPMAQWLLTGTGPLTHMVGSGAAFIRTDDPTLPLGSKASQTAETTDETSGKNAPDIELIWMPLAFLDHGFKAAPPGTEVFTLTATLLRPKSSGSLTLTSADPFEKPRIDANYFADDNDMKVLIKGVRLCLRVARSQPLFSRLDLRSDNTDMNDVFWLGDADPDKVTDEELREWLLRNVETLYHPTSTARMGSSPETSVVSPTLRVHGVDNLRIVDASILPYQISGHTTAPVIALAERAADIIKGEYTGIAAARVNKIVQ